MTLARDDDGSAELSPLLAELVADALEAARETDGAVDPTLGSVLVGLGYDRDISEEVARREVRRQRAASWSYADPPAGAPSPSRAGGCGCRPACSSTSARPRRPVPPTAAPGWCASCLETGVLVSLGGDIATAGPAPEGGWQVLVQDLPSDVPQQITLAAGSRRRDLEQRPADLDPGRRAAPPPRRPAHTAPGRQGPWRSITVVAPTCLRANTATTAAMVKGDDALAWLRSTGLPARLVSHAGRRWSPSAAGRGRRRHERGTVGPGPRHRRGGPGHVHR